MVTKTMFKNALIELGVEKGMILEVHSSLSSFGELEDGAETVINTLKDITFHVFWRTWIYNGKSEFCFHNAVRVECWQLCHIMPIQ